ncbi:glycosyltransferase family 4 protein [Alishewanella sp. HL-SH06]|uniref:glycosyltransferase family 4 protein n=1 Tax=Alishewanella sp. HL-SH06 TaxID=3461144 RepID=UPI0040428BF3
MNVLILSSVVRQFYLFEANNIKALKELGCNVFGIANCDGDEDSRIKKVDVNVHHIDIKRSPFDIRNILALRDVLQFTKENKIDIIHCHSPIGGVIGRLVKLFNPDIKVIYTAHGFHFFQGSGLLNWLIYFPVEWVLSFLTDCLITINQEDFMLAKRRLHSKKTVCVHGIGVDESKFNMTHTLTRERLGLEKDDFVVLCVGEFIPRKNHSSLIKAIAILKPKDNLKVLLCGRGVLEDSLRKMVKDLELDNVVNFMGYRDDINQIVALSDVFVFPSYQEGLPVSVMEAMLSGLPVIASDIRGVKDLIDDSKGGFLVRPDDEVLLAAKIYDLISDPLMSERMSLYNQNKVKNFTSDSVLVEILAVYSDFMSNRR